MKLELEIFGYLCSTSKFTINDIPGDYNDFGTKYDHDPDNAPDYGCGNMTFARIDPTPETLQKYGINEAEYALVAGQLEAGLSFGGCSLCA